MGLSRLDPWQLFCLLLCTISTIGVVLVVLIFYTGTVKAAKAGRTIINSPRSDYRPGRIPYQYDYKKETTKPLDPTNPTGEEPRDN